MKNVNLISAIIQLVLAIVLVGIAVYYLIIEDISAFLLFLIVGIIFIALSVRAIYKWNKSKGGE